MNKRRLLLTALAFVGGHAFATCYQGTCYNDMIKIYNSDPTLMYAIDAGGATAGFNNIWFDNAGDNTGVLHLYSANDRITFTFGTSQNPISYYCALDSSKKYTYQQHITLSVQPIDHQDVVFEDNAQNGGALNLMTSSPSDAGHCFTTPTG